MDDLTHKLNAAMQGDAAAQEELYELVKSELHDMARDRIRRCNDRGQVCTTLLVDKTFQRLVMKRSRQWASRKMFYGFAAKNMQQILIDRAQRRKAEKRGGGRQRLAGLDRATIRPRPEPPECRA